MNNRSDMDKAYEAMGAEVGTIMQRISDAINLRYHKIRGNVDYGDLGDLRFVISSLDEIAFHMESLNREANNEVHG